VALANEEGINKHQASSAVNHTPFERETGAGSLRPMLWASVICWSTVQLGPSKCQFIPTLMGSEAKRCMLLHRSVVDTAAAVTVTLPRRQWFWWMIDWWMIDVFQRQRHRLLCCASSSPTQLARGAIKKSRTMQWPPAPGARFTTPRACSLAPHHLQAPTRLQCLV